MPAQSFEWIQKLTPYTAEGDKRKSLGTNLRDTAKRTVETIGAVGKRKLCKRAQYSWMPTHPQPKLSSIPHPA
jgi:hypothetical protein